MRRALLRSAGVAVASVAFASSQRALPTLAEAAPSATTAAAPAHSLHVLAASADVAKLEAALTTMDTAALETTRDGMTPLMIAAALGDAAAVRALVAAGADVSSRGRAGATALMMAAANGHDDVVVALLENAAMVELQVRAVDDFGEAALGYAARFGHKMTMSHLMQRGAKLVQGHEYYGMRWGNLDQGISPPQLTHQYYGLKKQQS